MKKKVFALFMVVGLLLAITPQFVMAEDAGDGPLRAPGDIEIDTVSITVTPPMAGWHSTDATSRVSTSTEGISVSSASFKAQHGYSTDDPAALYFTEGRDYYVVIRLEVSDGYTLKKGSYISGYDIDVCDYNFGGTTTVTGGTLESAHFRSTAVPNTDSEIMYIWAKVTATEEQTKGLAIGLSEGGTYSVSVSSDPYPRDDMSTPMNMTLYLDDEVTISATPKDGYEFKGFYLGIIQEMHDPYQPGDGFVQDYDPDTLISTANPYTFSVSDDVVIYALFEKRPPAPTPTPAPTPDPSKDPNKKGTDGTAVGPGASEAAADKAITGMKSDSDPKGTKYAPLQLKSTKQAKTSVTAKWTKVSGATKYVLYGNKCGKANKMKKIGEFTGTSKKVTKVAGKKLKKGTYYKFIVVALDKNNMVVSTSKVIHVTTKGGKYNNPKKVTTKKPKTLKKGKSFKLAAKQSGKKIKKHRTLKYETTNAKVATVSGKGVIKAKAKGTCYVYAYAQNGVSKKIKVNVK